MTPLNQDDRRKPFLPAAPLPPSRKKGSCTYPPDTCQKGNVTRLREDWVYRHKHPKLYVALQL